MSSVTPRERHAVAKSLRYLADLPGELLENDGQFIEVLKYWIFADFKRYSYDETLTRLADLIDPTCSIYFVDTSTDTPDGYEQDGYYCCSHCHNELIGSFGYAWDDYQANDYKGESPFDYCPACGARVVRDEA